MILITANRLDWYAFWSNYPFNSADPPGFCKFGYLFGVMEIWHAYVVLAFPCVNSKFSSTRVWLCDSTKPWWRTNVVFSPGVLSPRFWWFRCGRRRLNRPGVWGCLPTKTSGGRGQSPLSNPSRGGGSSRGVGGGGGGSIGLHCR